MDKLYVHRWIRDESFLIVGYVHNGIATQAILLDEEKGSFLSVNVESIYLNKRETNIEYIINDKN